MAPDDLSPRTKFRPKCVNGGHEPVNLRHEDVTVTNLATETQSTDLRAVTAAAWRTAESAAGASGVQVRELTELADLEAVCHLFDEVWGLTPADTLITAELLRALSKAGSYIAGAYEGDTLLGGGMGFFSAPASAALHSHIAGVSAAARGRNIGFVLKVHQRAWALERGATRIHWTYDPLVRRNAYFNLVKLGALPIEYLPDFYGSMGDEINGHDASDRLLIDWDLTSAEVAAACAGSPRRFELGTEEREPHALITLVPGPDGVPRPETGTGGHVLVQVPADIESMRRSDPELARVWRKSVGEVLGGLLAEGGRVVGFDTSGAYVVKRARF